MIFISWIILSIVPAIIASSKGRSGAGFFLLSIILSPLIGIILALTALPDNKNIEKGQLISGDVKKCPACAELVKREAIVCRYCGRDLKVAE